MWVAMRRIATSVMIVAAAATACSATPDPEGPQRPVSRQAIVLDDFRVAGQARSVAHAFLRAYADAPGDGGRTLERLVGLPLAREWAHWVAIQNAGFRGSIDGSLQLGHLGTALPVRAPDGSLDDLVAYGVQVRATITFDLTDEQGEPAPSLQRLMDGLVVLVQGEDGAFRVINFVRDGLRLDQFFRVFEGAEQRRDGVTVEIRNLVQLERWQFGVEISNRSDRPVRLALDQTALLTPARDPATEPPLVTFPTEIAPGETAEGIVSFAAPTPGEAVDLQIAIAGPDGEAAPFVFGVPQPAGAASPSPTPGA
jgi:hypothetical protein